MDLFDLKIGEAPLIISSPHSGTYVPDDVKADFTVEGHRLFDTDFYVDRLYQDYADQNNVTFIKANYSRYVIDLNRPPDNQALYPGQAKVPLCPDISFKDKPIYEAGKAPQEDEISVRLKRYWQPYHDELAQQIGRVKAKHGYAILFDAHSILREVPLLFDGALLDLNLGTVGGQSCADQVECAAMQVIGDSVFSSVLNGRFIGGYITRRYGQPDQNVHALQMELCRDLYMDEAGCAYRADRASSLIKVLSTMLEAINHAAMNNARAGV